MKKNLRPTYFILGDGRLANQFRHYFQTQNLTLESWSRKAEAQKLCASLESLSQSLSPDTRCLLALSDGALGAYASLLQKKGFHRLAHFSGTAQVEGVASFHPLMSFPDTALSAAEFERIFFVGSESEEKFRDFFPSLKNPYQQIEEADRALYHANCVVAGNFANILWKNTMRDFEKMGLPQRAFQVYLEAVLSNFLKDPARSLTGPIVRGDLATIRKNLEALGDDFRAEIYEVILREYGFAPKKKGLKDEHPGMA
jgi:hypothetical protein